MNAAAKTISSGSLFEGSYKVEWVTKPMILATSLFIFVILSALMVIYVKDVERRFVSQTQMMQAQYNKAKIRQTQLLLEKSTWMSPARMEKQASEKLAMVYPNAKKVIVIRH